MSGTLAGSGGKGLSAPEAVKMWGPANDLNGWLRGSLPSESFSRIRPSLP
jgi:hypothetical protein